MGDRFDALVAVVLRLVRRGQPVIARPTSKEVADALRVDREAASSSTVEADERARRAAEQALNARHRPAPPG